MNWKFWKKNKPVELVPEIRKEIFVPIKKKVNVKKAKLKINFISGESIIKDVIGSATDATIYKSINYYNYYTKELSYKDTFGNTLVTWYEYYSRPYVNQIAEYKLTVDILDQLKTKDYYINNSHVESLSFIEGSIEDHEVEYTDYEVQKNEVL